ncbi:MAG: MFS transporter [Nitrososphaerales archaeon]
MQNQASQGWLTKDGLLISFSAFFADLGYQAVTAVFPLYFILVLKEPAYLFGLVLALSFGVGSLFSVLGGKLGNKRSKKWVSILGNALIPLMSFSALSGNALLTSALFIGGWWARYFRTPTRRAWLVEVSEPSFRSKIFGFLHALDVGGGLLAALYAVLAVLLLHIAYGSVILFTALPIAISTICLLLAGTKPNANWLTQSKNEAKTNEKSVDPALLSKARTNRFVFRALLISATLFGFSYFNFGYPILTVANSSNVPAYGIIAFAIYLGVSALTGYGLGSTRVRPIRAIWSYGYLVASLSSLILGLSFAFRGGLAGFYIGAAGLGFATGAVETFEPVLTSTLVKSSNLSGGMGFLSGSRAIGLFVANLIIGVLFSLSQFDAYLYAFLTAVAAALILAVTELRSA